MKKRTIVYASILVLASLVVTTFLTRSTLLAETVAGQAQTATILQDDVLALQELAEDTTLATIDLQAGFVLDPYLLRVIGGGETDASQLSDACTGYVNASPDAVLNWSGDSEALHLLVYSDVDPVLVVKTPGGEYVCNDDASAEVVDPLVTLEDPAAGAYEIHVGSYKEDEPAFGFLIVTELELDATDLAELDLVPLLDRRETPDVVAVEMMSETLMTDEGAIFGTQELAPGFGTITQNVAGGGDVPVFALEGVSAECTGFASLVPSLSFDWTGSRTNLTVFFEDQEDTALVVVTPDGELVCNSNASEDNLNPALALRSPARGQYDVYITSLEPNAVAFGELTITEETGAAPEILSPLSE